MSKKQSYLLYWLLTLSILFSCSLMNIKSEIGVDDALNIAIKAAESENYNINNSDIEVLKVQKKLERGPIRLSWLIRYFPEQEQKLLLKKEFWIVYFYPKGQMEEPRFLGGEFCVLVDLYSGKIISAFHVP